MLRFSCEKALLQSAVNTTSRAVAAKSSIPALEGILLEGGDTLTLSGYNMQTGIRTIVDAQVQSPGRIVLSARLFGEMIRKMPDDVIVFAADENLSVHLTCATPASRFWACPPTTIRSCRRWTTSSPWTSARVL